MFLFYFAILSAITPPVCAAVYVAAAIAHARWVPAAILAMRLGLAGFIVPYMFVYAPSLLLAGPPVTVALAGLTATVGVIALAAATVGHFRRDATALERGLLLTGALLLIRPGFLTDLLGGVALGLGWFLQCRSPLAVVLPGLAWVRDRVRNEASRWT